MRCFSHFLQERLLMYDFVGTPSGRSVGEVVTSCGDHWYLLGIGKASSRGIKVGLDTG